MNIKSIYIPWLSQILSRFALFFLVFCLTGLAAQQSPAPSPPPSPTPPPASASSAEFTQAADEVLKTMSEITGLPLRTPLKKTLRSREEIRAYVIRQMEEDKDAAQRYADLKTGEASR